ncbi:hypothetical protein GCM10009828_053820 [Actinoplanes couchii]|uniref:Uncharacterized protein n=1 Tax=Actinoplanes couchii TaxID=403638 RepID=A0ABQ3XQU3_9ACTN|nr:hypothetical protein Aco03nite_092670 [Actinoplanes couchii]
MAGTLLAVVAAVLLSPLLMARAASGDLPWVQLANVGQAYGGASALLSAAALCGVVASLLFHRRQVHQELAEMDRQQHLELIKLALDNPEFLEVLDPKTASTPHARQELFINLMMMYWLAVWELGVVDETELRAMVADLFSSEISRSWWARVGRIWIDTRNNRERRRFVSIVSGEFTRAQLSPPFTPPKTTSSRHELELIAIVALAGGLLIAFARSARRPRR